MYLHTLTCFADISYTVGETSVFGARLRRYTTRRKAYSAASCLVVARLASMGAPLGAETQAALLETAREHFTVVYGAGAFERCNPTLAEGPAAPAG